MEWVGCSPDEGLQVQMKEENLFRINGISFYMLSEGESFCTGLGQALLFQLVNVPWLDANWPSFQIT